MDIAHAGFNETAGLKLVSALGDLDSAQLAGPVKDVLKQMPVDGLQMQKIKVAGRDAFTDPLRHQDTFGSLQLSLVGDSQLVPEHRRPGINIRTGRSLGCQRSRFGKNVGAAPLSAPVLALEHLKHRYLIGAQWIALDLMQSHGDPTPPDCLIASV